MNVLDHYTYSKSLFCIRNNWNSYLSSFWIWKKVRQHCVSCLACALCNTRSLLLTTCIYSPVSSSLSPCLFRSTATHADVDGANAQGYDTGIGGSTSTIVSPLGSPQPQLRSHAQRNAAQARHMQVSAYFKILEMRRYADTMIRRYADMPIQMIECLRLRVYLNDYLIMRLFNEMKMEMGMRFLLWRKRKNQNHGAKEKTL